MSQHRQHHPSLYFFNGDIILSAPTKAVPDSDDRRLFRVHKVVLGHHSQVIQNMLSLSSPDDEGPMTEMHEGIPLLSVSDDASDLAGLLNALYNPATLPFKHMDPNTPLAIRGILRLADKYAIAPLRVRILEHFAADWPRTLVEWERLEDDITDARKLHHKAPEGKLNGLFLDDRFPEPAIAVRIAQDFNCPEILPAAFYRITRVRVQNDWSRMRSSDEGTKALRRCVLTVRWELLDHTDLLHAYGAREQLFGIYHQSVDHIMTDSASVPSQGCLHFDVCDRVRVDIESTVMPKFRDGVDPLGALHACFRRLHWPITVSGRTYALCSACRGHLTRRLTEQKELIWSGLPAMFGLK